MRPLFDKAFGREIQVVPTCISFDGVVPPDIIGIIAASAAVHISDIPFAGPIAGVRVCLFDGAYVINPTHDQIKRSKLEIVVAGTAEGITMVEGHAEEASEEEMLGAIEVAKKPIAEICGLIVKLRELAGKEKLPLSPLKAELQRAAEIRAYAQALLSKALFTRVKQERYAAVRSAIEDIAREVRRCPRRRDPEEALRALMEEIQYEILRGGILDKGLRVDGRGLEDIGPSPARSTSSSAPMGPRSSRGGRRRLSA